MSRPLYVFHRSIWRSVDRLSLPLCLLAALALRLFVCLSYPIDYNGYWHVFIARNLTREYAGLAHPPFFLLLLKAADAISHSRLAYEGVPILAGLGSVLMVYRILRSLRALESVAVLGALAMATSTSAIFLSCEVQSYSLAVFFILWSFRFYLDLVDADPDRIPRRSRVAFSVLACLSLLTEYFAGLYLIGCVLAPLLVASLRPSYGRRLVRSLPKRAAADFATLLPPAVVGALLYELIAKPWIHQLNHLPEFYFVPGRETAMAFLTRNLWNLFNLLSPVILWSPRRAAALVIGFAASALLVMTIGRRRKTESERRAVPAAFLVILLGLGMALGLAGKYPFGGAMRQQFLLFVFALIAGFMALDRLVRICPTPEARRALAVVCALAVAGNLVLRRADLRPPGREAFVAQTLLFDREFPKARTVQVDQLNFIGFFMAHHDWNWQFEGREAGNWAVERYRLEKAGRQLTLIAHRDRWNFDFHDAALYPALRSALHAGDSPCFSVFCVHTNLYKPPERRLPDLESSEVAARIVDLGEKAGLTPSKIFFRGNDVYAELCPTTTAP